MGACCNSEEANKAGSMGMPASQKPISKNQTEARPSSNIHERPAKQPEVQKKDPITFSEQVIKEPVKPVEPIVPEKPQDDTPDKDSMNEDSLVNVPRDSFVNHSRPDALQVIESPVNSDKGIVYQEKKVIKLFGLQSDCNTRILIALLKECEIDYKFTELVKNQRNDEYWRLCPQGAIPCLVDESNVVFGDIDVFAKYLSQVNPAFEATLFPQNDRLKFEQIIAWYFTLVKGSSDMLVDSATSQVVTAAPSAEGDEDDQHVRHLELFKRCMTQLDEMLVERKYVCTDELSWVDVVIYAATQVVIKLCDLDDDVQGDNYLEWVHTLEKNENFATINRGITAN